MKGKEPVESFRVEFGGISHEELHSAPPDYLGDVNAGRAQRLQ
jgi:hypothetical protein